MTIARGVAKKLRYKIQSVFGTAASASGAQSLRRVSSNIELSKATYRSNEIREDQQRANFRHGMKSVGGSISGELSVGTYADFMESFCRQAFQAAVTTGALTDVAAVVAGAGATFTRATGSYITAGLKVGDIGRWTGWTTTGTANNANNFLITGLTASVMTGQFLNLDAAGAKIAGDSVTFLTVGKKTWVPLTGHTDDMYTIEHFFSDISQSELFDSCKVSTMNIGLPPTGMSTIELGFIGRDMATDSAEHFTTPAAVTTGGTLAAVNGALFVNGTQVAILTGMTIAGTGNVTTGEVVGSNTTPDIWQGSVDVTGQLTAYFQNATLRDMFVDETEASVIGAFSTSDSATADFLAFVLPRIKLGGAAKDDGEKGLVLTMPYTALLNEAGGAGTNSVATTISIQDSLA